MRKAPWKRSPRQIILILGNSKHSGNVRSGVAVSVEEENNGKPKTF
jgi:hypothetical protein